MRKVQFEPCSEIFVLTIAVEETTMPQGGGFKANVELKNTSDECFEILHTFLFRPHISGWDLFMDDMQGVEIDPPEPRERTLAAGSYLKNIDLMGNDNCEPWHIGIGLCPGTHQLRFRSKFHVLENNEGSIAYHEVLLWSNTVVITVK